MEKEFPKTVSYNRFVELMQANLLPLVLFMNTCCLDERTGISFIGSTPIRVCHNKHISNHKVFKGIPTIIKSTLGWIYGFKLHLMINDKGEILNFVITQANVDDRQTLKDGNILKSIFGSLYATKGCISKELPAMLLDNAFHLVTNIRSKMKNV